MAHLTSLPGRAAALTAALLAALALPARAADDEKSDEKPKPDAPKVKVVPLNVGTFRSPQTQAINAQLAAAWEANGIRPAPAAGDYTFCRRLYLDVLGRIPTAGEVKAFAGDTGPNKRGRLIQKLLYDPEYTEEFAGNWAEVWSIWLMSRGTNQVYREQLKVWLEEHFAEEKPSHKKMVEALLTATGENNKNGAVNFILSHLGEQQRDSTEEGLFDAVPITSRVCRLFLGVQIQCAQCHDHPFNRDLKQADFWGVNAFFRQVRREGTPNMANNARMQVAAKLGLKDDASLNTSQIVTYEKAKNALVEVTRPAFLFDINAERDGQKPKRIPTGSSKSRRELLAEMVTSHDNFARAYVNRMWAHFFGRGMNKNPAADDFHADNEVVHPELLAQLGKDFAGYANYNVKEVITWICNSDAYNLSSVANPTNASPETDPFVSRMQLKAMSPEQLFESLMLATNPPPKKVKGKKQEAPALLDARKRLREQWMAKLVRNFGDDEGNEVTFNGTVIQALLMMNGKDLNDELTKKDRNTVSEAMKSGGTPTKIINELFLTALARPAKASEIAHIQAVMAGKGPKVGQDKEDKPVKGKRPVAVAPPTRPTQPNWTDRAAEMSAEAIYQDVFWALLNTNEFILNH